MIQSKSRFCVLDDDNAFLMVAKGHLSKYLPEIEGFFTSKPEEVYEYANDDRLTIYVIDMNLGDINGMDIYRKISGISLRSKFIFITGDTLFLEDEEIRRQTLSEGGIDFIEKPIKWHEIAIKIKNNLKLLEYQFHLEEKVEERTQMLIHADRLATVGTMVSSIVHEISSPLTFIKANQETFIYAFNNNREKIKDPEAIALFENYILPGVKDSLSGINRIENLLKSFRRFYKKEQVISVSDISSVLNEVKNLTYYSIKKQGINFSFSVDSSNPSSLKCNRQELIQIITNIVNNAVDAMEESRIKDKKLNITVKSDLRYIVITVSNNGPAIPEEILNKIFDPFFTTKKEDKGTGLGLSIVSQIIKTMGGSITVSNRSATKDTVDFILNIPINQNPKDVQ